MLHKWEYDPEGYTFPGRVDLLWGHILILRFSFIYSFLAVLGLRCCVGFSLVVASKGYCLGAVLGLLAAVASLVAEHRL